MSNADYSANKWLAKSVAGLRQRFVSAAVVATVAVALIPRQANAGLKDSLLNMLNKALKPIFDSAFGKMADQIINVMDTSHSEQMAANGKAFDRTNQAQVFAINHDIALNALPGAGYCEDDKTRIDSFRSVEQQFKTTYNMTKSNASRLASASDVDVGVSKSTRGFKSVQSRLAPFYTESNGVLNLDIVANREVMKFGFADGQTATRDLTSPEAAAKAKAFADAAFAAVDVKQAAGSPYLDSSADFNENTILLTSKYVDNIAATARITAYKQPFYHEIGEHTSVEDGKSTSSLLHEKIRQTYLSAAWHEEITAAGAPTPNMSVILRESAFGNLLSLKRYESQSARLMLLAALVAEDTAARGAEMATYSVVLGQLGRRG